MNLYLVLSKNHVPPFEHNTLNRDYSASFAKEAVVSVKLFASY